MKTPNQTLEKSTTPRADASKKSTQHDEKNDARVKTSEKGRSTSDRNETEENDQKAKRKDVNKH